MFGMSMTEILIIIVLALVVLGPEKLPKVAKMLGKGMREIRRATTDIKHAIEIDDIRAQLQNDFSPTAPLNTYAKAAQEDKALDDDDDWSDDEDSPYRDSDCEDVIDDEFIPSQVATIELADWHNMTGVGVLIKTIPISTPEILHLASVKTVAVTAGWTPAASEDDAQAVASEDDAPGATSEHDNAPDEVSHELRQISETISAQHLPIWQEQATVGTLIVKQSIPKPQLHLLGGVSTIPISDSPDTQPPIHL